MGERESGAWREGERERETSSRTDNFYFGLVVNLAWLSDKRTTQWRCVSGGGVEVMEGEHALFGKGEHPPYSKRGGTERRERTSKGRKWLQCWSSDCRSCP